MGVGKRLLSSVVTASMLLSVGSGLALANSLDPPERPELDVPIAERFSTKAETKAERSWRGATALSG